MAKSKGGTRSLINAISYIALIIALVLFVLAQFGIGSGILHSIVYLILFGICAYHAYWYQRASRNVLIKVFFWVAVIILIFFNFIGFTHPSWWPW